MQDRYEHLSGAVFNCLTCPTPCDGKSKGIYSFEDDVVFSERFEKLIMERINAGDRFVASKSVEDGYPDITIRNKTNSIVQYLEVKVQRRTFMSVERILPRSQLKPSETVALNLSDLLRYFEIQRETKIPTFILWVLSNRPCVVEGNEVSFFYQSTDRLERIFLDEGHKRRFRRRSGKGDVVDGQHRGVVVNYHFSIDELKPWTKLG